MSNSQLDDPTVNFKTPIPREGVRLWDEEPSGIPSHSQRRAGRDCPTGGIPAHCDSWRPIGDAAIRIVQRLARRL